MNIPLSIPNFEGNEEKYVVQAVKEGWVSTGGAYINELEEKLADFLNRVFSCTNKITVCADAKEKEKFAYFMDMYKKGLVLAQKNDKKKYF